MDSYSTLTFERQDGVALVTLNRPADANCLNQQMAAELLAVAERCAGDDGIKAVVLTGQGRFFCAGGDVNAFASFGEHAASEVKRLADELHRAISSFSRMRAPLIAAVNGVAAGAGFSLAMSADLVLAAESASFTMAYTAIGFSPDGSSSYFLPRLVGLRRAQELMFTNRKLSAAEAADWGVATRVVPGAALQDAALELAHKLANGALGAHAGIKKLLLATYGSTLEDQMELEGQTVAACAASPDGQEGVQAFLAKRVPKFS
ncbi:enoyl-CoA hydratase-related protein [Ramlibacter sp.]|uniref:enoyl-CoA hydratase/isomerase family protein n=1 Tax=Ramlibacter sp. TaxID=1917967 RepID=UPI0018305CA2|nr:enoyl-CoA hydratase-related protein [Ramlibacter sp.]MBA2673695.1 enoyl-CoA hydratase/isomerase family protein [Ramlibacter sp.]